MIYGKISGLPLHHNDCTYCEFRQRQFAKTKGRKKPRETELCALDGEAIAPPPLTMVEKQTLLKTKSERVCQEYTQENCTCQKCEEARKRHGRRILREVQENTGSQDIPNNNKGAGGAQKSLFPNTDGIL